MDSSLFVLFNSLRRFDTLRRSFVGAVHSYLSKAVLGHSKSTMAMWDGSIERSLMPSEFALKSASSIRLEMAPMRFRNNRASFMVALNKGAFTVASFLPVVSAKELSDIWSSYSPARLPRSWCIGRTAWTTRLRPSSGPTNKRLRDYCTLDNRPLSWEGSGSSALPGLER